MQSQKGDPSSRGVVTVVAIVLAGFIVFGMLSAPLEPQFPGFDDVSAFGETEIAQIDSWLQEQVEHSNFPSLSVAIVRDGTVVYNQAFGFENTWARRKASTDTRYHVASVSKTFTATLAVLLHDQGVINLDAPLATYLPPDVKISTEPDIGAKITLRQLASHTSGLPRGIPGRVQSVEGRYALEPERLYKLLPHIQLAYAPGTDDLYSNLGFGLLGHALELAAGKSLNDLLQELICEPLELKHTAFHVDENLAVATGYSTPPQLPEKHSVRERLAGSGGLVASAEDLAKFLGAQMKPGWLTSQMLEQLHTGTALAGGETIHRALGWSIKTNISAGKILSKNGGRGNCSAWIGFAPEHKLGVAVISNVGDPDVDPIGTWLLERSVEGGCKLSSAFGYAKVAPYSGVRWDDDRPVVRIEGRWFPLVSIDNVPVEAIVEFSRREFGDKAQKRFGEDLVELLSKMGHEPKWEVTLAVETRRGTVERIPAKMTEENRGRVRSGSR